MGIGTLWRGENDYDFVGKLRYGIALSAVFVLASIGALLIRNLDLGIDFEGGTAFTAPAAEDVSVADVRDELRGVGLEGAKIQFFGVGDNRSVRVQTLALSDISAGEDEIREAMGSLQGVEAEEVSITEVGPSWGNEISNKAQRALIFFFVAIAAYITLRFEWKMAVAALAAVVHDIIVTVGVYAIFQFEVTPATVIAFLTILGYSLYDTIVVFDKIDENVNVLRSSRAAYPDMVNVSLNEVLMRSVNTTITSILPVLSLLVVGSLFLGAATLQEFALALAVGMTVGAYSSVFTAAPVLIALKEREPRYRDRDRASGPTPTITADALAPAVASTRGPTGIEARPRRRRRR
jgi:preprotein translocase subunit SecF